MIELGMRVRDKVSGFEGVAVARTDWLSGCTRYSLQPKVDKDGKLPDVQGFDEPQLEVVTEKKVAATSPGVPPGGPRPEPQRR